MTFNQGFTILILGLAVVLPLGSNDAQPASSSTENLIVNPDDASQVASMSKGVIDRLAEAQKQLDAKEYQSALDALATMLRSSDLNGNEIGQIHNMRGFVYFTMSSRAVYSESATLFLSDSPRMSGSGANPSFLSE